MSPIMPHMSKLGRQLRMRCAAPSPTGFDAEMMREALGLAREAAGAGEAPIGAIVYETASQRILARARNTREGENDPAGHAELIAIRESARALGDWRLNGCTLIVTLEPCCMCAGAIVSARVGRVVYGADDPKAGAVRSLFRLLEDPRLNHRVTPIRGLMAGESSDLLREFFRSRRGAVTADKQRRPVV